MNQLKEKLKQLPSLPGVYKMLDSTGQIIYVGKSNCLKKRVSSYFTPSPKPAKIEKMILFINDIDYIVTDTHLEARLLECQLIKTIKPYFNAQMKNDKRYFYVKVGHSRQAHVLSIVPERDADTFGPFRRKQLIQSMIDSFTYLFPIVKKNNHYDFIYQTLPQIMSVEDFMNNKQTLMEIFLEENKMLSLINQLQLAMREEAAHYHYEKAARYRDLVNGLTNINHVLHDYKRLLEKDILLKIPVRDGEKLFYISKGQIILKKYFRALSPIEIDKFLAEANNIKAALIINRNEKAEIDFQNILFSELQALPDDWILLK
ncbi:GIY-YIG nuclease family protein [Acetobacterium woodii]|nr:GIY-YIG nuclease family protein [Acetobacterium woodii]